MRHPIQPVEIDDRGTPRFRPNKIVQHLLEKGGIDLNKIACLEFSQDDREQFAQLIGYSLSGLSELSYVSDETLHAAEKMAESPIYDVDARNVVLRDQLQALREGIRRPIAELFGVHPDDLKGGGA